MKVKNEREVAQLCPTLSEPMDCSLPSSSIHGIFQASMEIKGIGRTAATAVKLGKTVFAFFLGINITALELFLQIRPFDAIKYISHQEIFITNKLVAWV